MAEKSLRNFIIIWITQLLSTLASTMTTFAVSVWVYQETGSATLMAGTMTFYIAPFIISSFFAGPIIDKYSRKFTLAVSDSMAILGTLAILASFIYGRPSIVIIYASAILNGIGGAFQWPAFASTISLMVPKQHISRANGLMSIKSSGPGIVGPIIAGALYPILGMSGILLIDIASCALAVSAILILPIPTPEKSKTGQARKKQNIFRQAAFGFVYIFKRPALFTIQLYFLVMNLFGGMAIALTTPLVLARTSGNAAALGSVRSAASAGMLLAGLLMTAWSGFKKRTNGILLGGFIIAFFGQLLFGIFASVPILLALSLLGTLGGPIANTSNQAIWQVVVPQDLQGRVFSARRLIAWITQPLAPLLAGVLADAVFEPAMLNSKSIAGRTLGGIFGNTAGSGTGLLVSLTGLIMVCVVVCYCFIPAFNNAEARLETELKAELETEAISRLVE